MSGNFFCRNPSYPLTDAPACGTLTVPTRLIQLIRYRKLVLHYDLDQLPRFPADLRTGARRLRRAGSVSGHAAAGRKAALGARAVHAADHQPEHDPARLPRAGDGGLHLLRRRTRQLRLRPDPGRSRAGRLPCCAFDAAVQELLYLGMRSEELRRRIPEGGTTMIEVKDVVKTFVGLPARSTA